MVIREQRVSEEGKNSNKNKSPILLPAAAVTKGALWRYAVHLLRTFITYIAIIAITMRR